MPKYVKYGPQYGSKCTDTVVNFLETFKDMFLNVCGKYDVEIIEITEEEFENLPEFTGF